MVAELRVLPVVIDNDKKSVIETLERAMEQAKAGDIRHIAIAVVRPDYAMNTSWSDCSSVAPLAGAVALLNKRLIEAVDE